MNEEEKKRVFAAPQCDRCGFVDFSHEQCKECGKQHVKGDGHGAWCHDFVPRKREEDK